ncbi:MAG: ECF-type sigma factor [Acidobacteriota bacterium]
MPGSPKTTDITRLLRAWHEGSAQAEEELWSLLYQELKMLARSSLRRKDRPARHGTTSLVHRAYLRLLGADVDWRDRGHFFAVACRAMRFVLIDEARRRLTDKRRSEMEAIADSEVRAEVVDPASYRPEEVLAVHQALAKLAEVNPRHEKLVELRYFGGLSVEETAEVLGVTSRTVVRDWRSVRLWLHHRLEGDSIEGEPA